MWDINNWEFLNNTGVGQYIKDHLVIVVIITFLIIIFIYSIIAVFLNKLNKAMYGKTTWMAWIPGFRTYLLGKLTIHPIVGIILVLGMVLCFSITITINGTSKVYQILPDNIITPYIITYFAIIVVLFIYAFIKTNTIIRKGEAKDLNIENRNVVSAYDERFSKRIDNNSIKEESKPIVNSTNNDKTVDNFYQSYNDSSKVDNYTDENNANTGKKLSDLIGFNNSNNDSNNSQNP